MLKFVVKLVVVLVAIVFGFSLNFLIPMIMGMPDMGMMGMGQMPPPAVKAMVLTPSPVDARAEYIATVEPVREVLVRSEVAGYIDKVHFKEGSLVEEGDLLFTINQKQYRAVLKARQAQLESANAEYKRAEKFWDRLKNAGERSVSQSDLDEAESAYLRATAMQNQAQANLALAQINLDHSEIRAPINGRIGVAMVTKGNYVDSMTGAILATIVQVDPIRVVFSMTDRAYLDGRQKILNGNTNILVAQVRLPNGTLLPTLGKAEFSDNAMNPNTGTMAIHYLFDNANEMLVAGGYVNIMLGKSDRPMGLRIPQRAVLLDTDGPYVLTTNEEGLVNMVRVVLGKQIEGDMIIESGLKEGDVVIVDGVQKAMPGMPATVTLMEAAQ